MSPQGTPWAYLLIADIKACDQGYGTPSHERTETESNSHKGYPRQTVTRKTTLEKSPRSRLSETQTPANNERKNKAQIGYRGTVGVPTTVEAIFNERNADSENAFFSPSCR